MHGSDGWTYTDQFTFPLQVHVFSDNASDEELRKRVDSMGGALHSTAECLGPAGKT